LHRVPEAEQPPPQLRRVCDGRAQADVPVAPVAQVLVVCERGFLKMLGGVRRKTDIEPDALAAAIMSPSVLSSDARSKPFGLRPLVYDFISGFHRNNSDGTSTLVNGRLPLFRNFDDTSGNALPRLLREVMNTVGKPGQLGGGIRCVVSVSMLTEGWDANTVTHVLGIRAFGTQLLCEQVIGRALRRHSYELNSEGLFNVEYADDFDGH
jgi:hypothetical protein